MSNLSPVGGRNYPNDNFLHINEIKDKLDSFFENDIEDKEICDWVQEYVGEERAHETPFIRTLVTCVFSDCIETDGQNWKLNLEKFKPRCSLLLHFVEHDWERQIQVLYALQIMMRDLGHPKGLLKDIFYACYEHDVVTLYPFCKWRDFTLPEEPAGKSLAVNSAEEFLSWLIDSPIDTYSSSDSSNDGTTMLS